MRPRRLSSAPAWRHSSAHTNRRKLIHGTAHVFSLCSRDANGTGQRARVLRAESAWARPAPVTSLLPIPVIGSIARGTQRLNCPMHAPWSRALNNSAVECRVLWNQLLESVKDYHRCAEVELAAMRELNAVMSTLADISGAGAGTAWHPVALAAVPVRLRPTRVTCRREARTCHGDCSSGVRPKQTLE